MPRSRVILLGVAVFAAATVLALLRNCDPYDMDVPRRREAPSPDYRAPAPPMPSERIPPEAEVEPREDPRDSTEAKPAAQPGRVPVRPRGTPDLARDTDPVPDTPVPVTGTVFVPERWGRLPVSLSFRYPGRDPVATVAIGFGDGGTELGDTGVWKAWLEPGFYFIEVHPFQWRSHCTVPRSGAHVNLRLPEPVEICLEILDAQTGERLRDAAVSWHSWHSYFPELAGRTPDEVEFDESTSTFQFRAPPGRIGVFVKSKGYVECDTFVETRGDRFYRVRLERAASLTVRFELQGEAYSAEDLVVRVRFPGGTTTRGGEGMRVVFSGLDDGPVEVSVDLPAGFRPPASRRLEIRRAKPAEIVFRLARE